jgi:hypothetical protein
MLVDVSRCCLVKAQYFSSIYPLKYLEETTFVITVLITDVLRLASIVRAET